MGYLGAGDVGKLIERHKKVNAQLKHKKHKKGYVILCLVDDFADAGEKVMHSSTHVLTTLRVWASLGLCMLAVDSETASHQSHLPNERLLDARLADAQCKGIVIADGGTVCNIAYQDSAPDVQYGNTKQARFLVPQSLE